MFLRHDLLIATLSPASSTRARIIILALDTSSRDSFYSCPDLSPLQISHPASAVSPVEFASDLEGDINTDPERPSSSESPHLQVPKRRSKRKEVSRKARGVFGKVRGLRRIAADKMAHPAIKIDTNVQTKRGLEDSEVSLGVVADHNTGLGVDEEDIPPFLRQSVAGE